MPTPEDPEKARRRIIAARNRALGLVLVGLAALFFLITVAKLRH